MNRKELLMEEIRPFHLPAYNEIPNVGLFLEQVIKYVTEYTEPLESVSITGSMVSNYVKKHILKNPIRKQYDREQIAAVLFISLAKTVLSLDDIQLVLQMTEGKSAETVYELFRKELTETITTVFEADGGAAMEKMKEESAEEQLLRYMVITIAHKIYLDKYFKAVKEDKNLIE